MSDKDNIWPAVIVGVIVGTLLGYFFIGPLSLDSKREACQRACHPYYASSWSPQCVCDKTKEVK